MTGFYSQNIFDFIIFTIIITIFHGTCIEGRSWQGIRFCHENIGMIGIRKCHNGHTTNTFLSVMGGKIRHISELQHMADFNLTAPGVEICTNGVWALYTEINYRKGTYGNIGSGGLCYVCPQEEDQEACNDNFGTKSARYLGNLDADQPGLSLFPGDGVSLWPYGDETYISGKRIQISFTQPICVAFWAFTSSSKWTIFSKSNFTGHTACLNPRTSNGTILPYGWGELNYHYVGSVRIGCESNVSHQLHGADETMLTIHDDGSIIQENDGEEDYVVGKDFKNSISTFSSCKSLFSPKQFAAASRGSQSQIVYLRVLILFSFFHYLLT